MENVAEIPGQKMTQVSGEQTSGLPEPAPLCGPLAAESICTGSCRGWGVQSAKGPLGSQPLHTSSLSVGQAEALGCQDYMSAESPGVLMPHHCTIPEAAGAAHCCLVLLRATLCVL